MKFMTVGGTFSDNIEEVKVSSIIDKLTTELYTKFGDEVHAGYQCNCGNISTVESAGRISKNYDLNIWMPNVSNAVAKLYPKKGVGNVLICSKVLRDNRTIYDAVGRIFKMGGNAVIAIEKGTNKFVFTLLDALGNGWVRTSDIKKLAEGIYKFYNWTKHSERIGSKSIDLSYNIEQDELQRLEKFCDVNTKIANLVEAGNTNRYFGNCSTRCSLMFPSTRSRNSNYVIVSRRNSNKKRLSAEDMLITTMNLDNSLVIYQGDIKPSVDTPIQLDLYKQFPFINYMVHGHAYEANSDFTGEYYACGDIRESRSVVPFIKNVGAGCVNLKHHGFLVYAKTIEDLQNYINGANFIPKLVGKEFI